MSRTLATKPQPRKRRAVIYDMPAVNASNDAEVIAVNVDAVALVSSIGNTSKKGLVSAANALMDVKAFINDNDRFIDSFRKDIFISTVDLIIAY